MTATDDRKATYDRTGRYTPPKGKGLAGFPEKPRLRDLSFNWGRLRPRFTRRKLVIAIVVFVALTVIGSLGRHSRHNTSAPPVAQPAAKPTAAAPAGRYVAADGLVVDCGSMRTGSTHPSVGLPDHPEVFAVNAAANGLIIIPANVGPSVVYWVDATGHPLGRPITVARSGGKLVPTSAQVAGAYVFPGMKAPDHYVAQLSLGPACAPVG